MLVVDGKSVDTQALNCTLSLFRAQCVKPTPASAEGTLITAMPITAARGARAITINEAA